MTQRIYKTIAIIVSVVVISTVLTVVIGLIFNSPKYYPDSWLKIENTIVPFIERITLPIKITRLSWLEPEDQILMPVYGVSVNQVSDSWQAPRPDSRVHEGQDIFAPKGTPIFSATSGYIARIDVGDLGGNVVYVVGAGGRRYYYAHLDRIPEGLHRGQKVTTDTVIGFVGNTGNAEMTPYHLHLGVYIQRRAINPLPLLVDRPW